MSSTRHIVCRLACAGLLVLCLLLATAGFSQPIKHYFIKNGRMYIELTKHLRPAELDSFVTQFELQELDLKSFLRTNKSDSLAKLGWKVEINNETGLLISKGFEPFDVFKNPADKIIFPHKTQPLFAAVNNGVVVGANRFRNKLPFVTRDSVVRFFLRNHKDARRVSLAGSFNNWVPDQLFMQQTDSGWIYQVKLGPGKYWYKFIVDGNWTPDKDNLLSENDGLGNINSVYYKPNTVFLLQGFPDAKKVFLAGSFNNWKSNELTMKKTATGWELPVYLARGTHSYKFVVDGRWYADENNNEKLPDGQGAHNSVLRIGKPHRFLLRGFENAKQVFLVGSFNNWKDAELAMTKTAAGWEIPYTLGPGNHEYKFKVDGKWITDPANPMNSEYSGNSYLIIEPNYTFRLKGFNDAKKVFLAGDFNQWDPKAYAMRKQGDDWVFPVQLSVGKHLYKFVVDGKWIIDPGNKLWEQNEHGTGNSIIWIER
ncbi:MAG TPA: glycogen-binding domain-containing protein [Flavisolibacter sp.]|nr:glycogen-binding domain-containing protein [Flavisolibacter sp.]